MLLPHVGGNWSGPIIQKVLSDPLQRSRMAISSLAPMMPICTWLIPSMADEYGKLKPTPLFGPRHWFLRNVSILDVRVVISIVMISGGK